MLLKFEEMRESVKEREEADVPVVSRLRAATPRSTFLSVCSSLIAELLWLRLRGGIFLLSGCSTFPHYCSFLSSSFSSAAISAEGTASSFYFFIVICVCCVVAQA
jgi:hypothetical protein